MKADASHAYHPYWVTSRPGGKPLTAPEYRVLVNKQFWDKWEQIVTRVGLESATQFWDHVAWTPNQPPLINRSSFLRGAPGAPMGEDWSKTIHYEISSMARINYQYNDEFQFTADSDVHKVVAIRSINYSSH